MRPASPGAEIAQEFTGNASPLVFKCCRPVKTPHTHTHTHTRVKWERGTDTDLGNRDFCHSHTWGFNAWEGSGLLQGPQVAMTGGEAPYTAFCRSAPLLLWCQRDSSYDPHDTRSLSILAQPPVQSYRPDPTVWEHAV